MRMYLDDVIVGTRLVLPSSARSTLSAQAATAGKQTIKHQLCRLGFEHYEQLYRSECVSETE